jgi:hypothetical protein
MTLSKEKYWKLKEEAIENTSLRARFGRGNGPTIRQII